MELRRRFGGRPDLMMSPSEPTGPPPSCPLRATPRGCHGASLPWPNLSYCKENKWHTSRLLPTAAAPRFSSQGLALRICQKGIWKSTRAARGKRGEQPYPPPNVRSNLFHSSLWSTLRKRLRSEFPLQHTSFYQPYFWRYFVNYNKFAFFWIFRCFKRYPKDAIRP